jgi:hypothetical protein
VAGEPLAAPLTLVVKRRRRRRGVGMSPLVLSQVAHGGEVLAALGAEVRLQTQVALAM